MKYQPKLLKLSLKNIKMYKDDEFTIDFTTQRRVFNYEEEDEIYRLFSSVYIQKVMAIVGINASGKTTAIDIFEFILLVYFCNDSISEDRYKLLIDRFYNNQPIRIELFYGINDIIYKIESHIQKDKISNEYYFSEEILYQKKANQTTSKISLYEMDLFTVKSVRSKLNDAETSFLESGKSIAKLTIKEKDMSIVCPHMIDYTSFYNNIDKFPIEVVQYLDKSIEYIDEIVKEDSEKSDVKLYKIKFIGQSEISVTTKEMWKMLSSGTRKGIILFDSIKKVLSNGGYVVVDEIENHFNKSIIIDIIKLFRDPVINTKAAALVFTTHYPELLEAFKRDDGILIAHRAKNDSKLELSNLSKLMGRTDYKKSELFLSDYFHLGTAIEYDKFLKLKKSILNNNEKVHHQIESILENDYQEMLIDVQSKEDNK